MLSKSTIENTVIKHPRQIVIFFLIIGIISGTWLLKLRTDPNPYLLGQEHPSRSLYKEFRESFTGSGNRIVILLESKETVFKAETLSRIKRLTEALENLTLITSEDKKSLTKLAAKLPSELGEQLNSTIRDGLDGYASFTIQEIMEKMQETGQLSKEIEHTLQRILIHLSPIKKVTSLSNTDNILGTDGTLDIHPIYEEVPTSKTDLDEIKRKVLNNELFKRTLVSDDGKSASIYLELAIPESDSVGQFLIYKKISKIVEKDIPGQEKHYIAGFPVVTSALGHAINQDSKRLSPVVVVIIMITLLFLFRSLMGVMVPMLVVMLSLAMTLAIKVLLGIPLNVITVALPVFILSIGVADGIHIFSEYRDLIAEGIGKVQAVRQTMYKLMSPVVMTSITTAAAFLALSVTEIVQIRYFGIFVAIGTLAAMVLSLVFIPALLLLLPQPKVTIKKEEEDIDSGISKSLDAISRLAIRQPWIVLSSAFVIITIACIGTSLVKVDNNNVEFHSADSPLVIATKEINKNMAGSLDLNILIRSKSNQKEPLKEPANLHAMADLAKFMEAHPHVGKVLDITALIRRINYVLHDGDKTYNRIPNAIEKIVYKETNELNTSTEQHFRTDEIPGRKVVSQYLLLYENSGGNTLSDVVNLDYKTANMRVILRTNSSHEVSKLQQEISNYAAIHFPADLSIQFSGPAGILADATNEIVIGQINSLALSTVIILAILFYTFRSLKEGLVALIPLAGAILINFGTMGLFKVPLDIGSSVVASIVIGIGVDYSIHYIKRMHAGMEQGLSFEEAILYAVRYSGKPIVFNALVVGIGFLAMLFSSMTPLFISGWMITITMFISAIGTIVLLPALLSLLKEKSLPHKTEKTVSSFPSSSRSHAADGMEAILK